MVCMMLVHTAFVQPLGMSFVQDALAEGDKITLELVVDLDSSL